MPAGTDKTPKGGTNMEEALQLQAEMATADANRCEEAFSTSSQFYTCGG